MVTCGKRHTVLGMKLEFKDNDSAEIETLEHIQDAIKDFGEALHIETPTTANHSMLDVSTDVN